ARLARSLALLRRVDLGGELDDGRRRFRADEIETPRLRELVIRRPARDVDRFEKHGRVDWSRLVEIDRTTRAQHRSERFGRLRLLGHEVLPFAKGRHLSTNAAADGGARGARDWSSHAALEASAR